jgi:hypothetical protein
MPKALVAQLARLVQSSLAYKQLEDGMLQTVRSGAKDTNAVAVQDPHRFAKPHVYGAQNIVHLRDETE